VVVISERSNQEFIGDEMAEGEETILGIYPSMEMAKEKVRKYFGTKDYAVMVCLLKFGQDITGKFTHVVTWRQYDGVERDYDPTNRYESNFDGGPVEYTPEEQFALAVLSGDNSAIDAVRDILKL
jgi:hypothetical protein